MQPAGENNSDANNRSNLGSLYPAPKTYDEHLNERKAVEAIRLDRLPKYIILRTSVQIYAILILLYLIIKYVPSFVSSDVMSEVMRGVFFSFLLGLIWLGCALWATSNISRYFQQFGRSTSPFFALYVCAFPPLVFALYQLTAQANIIFLAAATCVHFVVVYILAKIILR